MLSYWAWICLVEADYVLKVYISYMAVTLALDRSCRRSLRGWRSDVGTLALDRSHKTSLALNQKVFFFVSSAIGTCVKMRVLELELGFVELELGLGLG